VCEGREEEGEGKRERERELDSECFMRRFIQMTNQSVVKSTIFTRQ